MQAMWKHRGALVERGAGGPLRPARLPLLAAVPGAAAAARPGVDIYAVYGLVFLDRAGRCSSGWASSACSCVTAAYAFRLDRETLRPLWTLPLQQFVYRQLMYLVLLQSVITALTGGRLRWHKLRRTGQAAHSAPALRL